jgi:hypothetical protein
VNDLGRLLDQAVPEPPRHLDATAVLDAARRRRRTRASWAGVAAAGLVVATLVTSFLLTRPEVDRSSLDPADVPLRLSALDRRVPLSDGVRGAVEVLPVLHPGEASLAATVDRHQVYLFERADGDLCLLAEHEGSAESSCVSKIDLLGREGLTLVVQEWDGRPATLVVAMPDGYDRAELGSVTARAVNNVAALPVGVSASTVTLSGAGVPEVSLDVRSNLRGVDVGSPSRPPADDSEANARAALLDLARSAQLYAETHGSMAGFADALTAEQGPAIRGQLAELTDTSAVARVGSDSCLGAEFATGRITKKRC